MTSSFNSVVADVFHAAPAFVVIAHVAQAHGGFEFSSRPAPVVPTGREQSTQCADHSFV